jgi:hypothetical protein
MIKEFYLQGIDYQFVMFDEIREKEKTLEILKRRFSPQHKVINKHVE